MGEREGGGWGTAAGSRKCVLRAAINDSIEHMMAPYMAKRTQLALHLLSGYELEGKGSGAAAKGDNCFHCARCNCKAMTRRV